MKKAIVQFFIPSSEYQNPEYNQIGVNQELFEYSKISVKQYASKIGAEYLLIGTPKINWIHPTFERFDLFYNNDWWERFTHVLYLDTDIIVWPDAPDIFEMYPDTQSFKPVRDRIAERQTLQYHENRAFGTCLEKFSAKTLQLNRFNAGVFMLTKPAVDKMKSHLDYKVLVGDDNEMLIHAMLESEVSVEKMDWKFNKKNGTGCYFGHASGQQKFKPNFKMLEKAKQVFIS